MDGGNTGWRSMGGSWIKGGADGSADGFARMCFAAGGGGSATGSRTSLSFFVRRRLAGVDCSSV